METLQQTYERFGKKISPPMAAIDVEAEIGCQTCTAGLELLAELKCPLSNIVNNKHCLVGIRDILLVMKHFRYFR